MLGAASARCLVGLPLAGLSKRQAVLRLRRAGAQLRRVTGALGSRARATVTVRAASAEPSFKDARSAIEGSDAAFKAGRTQEALLGFLAALEMKPNEDEARAAHYNAACCYTKMGQFEEAADQVITAVNDYDLKFAVALKDDDLLRLREQKVFDRVVASVKGGLSEGAFLKARQEAKSPFMLVRTVVLGGLAAGAGLGLFIIISRVAAALKGGDGAPDLQESLQNLGINSGILAVLVFFLLRDNAKRDRELGLIEREEKLGKLMVQVNDGRGVTLQTLRGFARPLILAGTRGQVNKAMKAAEAYRNGIKDRGIELIPVVLNMADPADKISALKAELAAEKDSRPKAQGFSKAPKAGAEKADAGKAGSSVQVGKQKLRPVETAEWEAWLESVRKVSSVEDTNVYVQVQLDGSVRSSGVGVPNWDKLMTDVPPLDDVRSKLMQ